MEQPNQDPVQTNGPQPHTPIVADLGVAKPKTSRLKSLLQQISGNKILLVLLIVTALAVLTVGGLAVNKFVLTDSTAPAPAPADSSAPLDFGPETADELETDETTDKPDEEEATESETEAAPDSPDSVNGSGEAAPSPSPSPSPSPEPEPESEGQVVSYTVLADDDSCTVAGSPCSSALVAQSGDTVKITFNVSSENTYYGGLDFRSSGFSNTGTIPPGGSTTVEFTANSTFVFNGWWPSSGVKKWDATFTVN